MITIKEWLVNVVQSNKINVVGLGPGNIKYLSTAGIECIKEAEIIVGSTRQLSDLKTIISEKQEIYILGKLAELIAYLKENIERKISYNIITCLDITKNLKDKRKIYVIYELNNSLRYFFKWCNRNIAQNIYISINLRRKYAYKLYLYMLRRAIEANGVIKVSYDELGRRVGRPRNEENKEFNRCIKAAVAEINKISAICNYHNFEISINRKRDNLTTIRIQQFLKRKRDNNGETSKR